MAKQLCPSDEYTLWEAEDNVEWKQNTVLSYEMAFLRKVIVDVFSEKTAEFEKMMLSNFIKEAEKPWKWMSEEERAESVRKAKERYRQFRGK